MRYIKITIAVIVSLSLHINTASAQTEAKNLVQEINGEQIHMLELMSGLGIISDADKSESALNRNITRAQAATVLLKTVGLEAAEEPFQKDDGNVPLVPDNEDFFAEKSYYNKNEPEEADDGESLFNDVKKDHWAYANIELAALMGLVNGFEDSCFKPEESVEFAQAVKMVVTLLGYGVTAKMSGDYPIGYLSVASKIRITKNTSARADKQLTKIEFYQLIYNSIKVDLQTQITIGQKSEYTVNQGVNILTSYFKVHEGKGIVTANRFTAIDGAAAPPDKCVRIDNVLYNVGLTHADKCIAQNVAFYYKESADDDADTLIYIYVSKSNKELVIDSDEIESAEGLQSTEGMINYYNADTGRQNTARINTKAHYIYNNKKIDIISDEDIRIKNGSIRLFDWTDDGLYDVVFIDDVKTNVIDSVAAVSNIVYFKYGGGMLLLNPNDSAINVVVTKNGAEASLSDLREWDIAEIKQSKFASGKTLLRVDVVADEVEGTITEISQDKLIIDDVEYKLGNNTSFDIKVAENITAFLDSKKRVFAVKKGFRDEFQYDYVISAGSEASGIDKKLYVKMAGENYKIKPRYLARNIIIDGKKADRQELLNLFSNRQLICYKTNDKEEISEIKTFLANDDKRYDLENFSRDYKTTGTAYNNLGHRYGEMYSATGSTKVIIIPDDNDKDNEKKYTVGTRDLLITNDTLYPDIEIYDADENYIISVLVVIAESSLQMISGVPNLYFVTGVGKAVNDVGEECYKINYTNLRGGSIGEGFMNDETRIDVSWGNNKEYTQINKGDVVHFLSDQNNNIEIIAVLFDSSGVNVPGKEGYISRGTYNKKGIGEVSVHDALYYSFEKVVEKSGNSIVMYGQAETGKKTVGFTLGSSARIYVYNSCRGVLSTANVNDIEAGDNVFIGVIWQGVNTLVVYR